MATFTVSPNMNLVIPGVGLEAGPAYATDVNNSLTIIDGHTHNAGSGIQITPSGLNINTSLPMAGNFLTLTGAISFQAQTSDPGVGSIYEKGVDLYYEDGAGNVIRMTQSGSVAGAAGTITGLPSGTASASYVGGTFVFQSATATAANIDAASYVFRNNTPSSLGLTLEPPSSLASNYTLTLPTIPAQTNVMTLDASGNMGSITYDTVGQNMTSVGANAIVSSITSIPATEANIIANATTRAVGSTVGIGGVAVSPSSGAYSTTSTSAVPVPGLDINITTTGRPVVIMVVPDGSSGTPQLQTLANGSGTGALFSITRTGVSWGNVLATSANIELGLPPNLIAVDFPSAGTYAYFLYINALYGGGTAIVNGVKLIAYEL